MVFTPIWDHNPFKWPTPPYVMWALVIINFVVFFVQAGAGPEQLDQADHVAGLIPAAFTGAKIPGTLPAPLTIITSMFLHANFMHVAGNMLFLFVFGDDVEEVLGHWRFLAFYLACGIGAALAFVLSDPSSTTELIGASGAVAGVISAYLLFRPCAKMWCLLGLIPLHLRAYWVIGSWVIWQVIEVSNRAQDGTAYWAHVGGLITGAILFVVMRPAGVELFDCAQEDTALPGVANVEPPR
jgi:membrane associated rhomboid family serine protease